MNPNKDDPVCGTCGFRDMLTGECRRFPPQVVATPRGEEVIYPEVSSQNPSCGEYMEE